MALNKNIYQEVEKYLEGKMTGEELQDFEDRLKTEEELRLAAEELPVIVECIKESGRAELLNNLKSLESSLPEVGVKGRDSGLSRVYSDAREKVRRLYRQGIQVAAIAACVLGLFFGYARPQYQFVQNPPERRDHIASINVGSSPATRNANHDGVINNDAAQAFENEKYRKVIRELRNVDNKSEAEWLILGNSYFLKKRYRKASESLNMEHFNPGSESYLEAKFLLALSLNARGKIDEARKLLEEIIESNDKYEYEAGKILESKRFKP